MNKTLNTICEELFNKYNLTELKVMYRVYLPDVFDGDKGDLLFGYCTVSKKMSGFSLHSDDGDNYEMSDEIDDYVYKPHYFDGLVVWFTGDWITS